jgi:DNA-binding protein H-NS
MSRYRELLAKQAELTREIEAARAEEAEAAAKTCRELIELYDLSPQAVGFVKTQQVAAKKVAKGDKTFAVKTPRVTPAPLYRDPESGSTWSGRGKTPKWLAEADNRDDFLIRDGESGGEHREAA